MRYLEEKKSTVSFLIENQFPSFVQENNSRFLRFLESYYESLENQYQPLDIASNLIDYYNVGYYRKNQLVEKTTLSGNLLKTTTTITVESTLGFPETNGYIQIDTEIIFYKQKTDTQFLECVRGTKALVLQSVPKSEIVLTDSVSAEHRSGVQVYNIAYTYAIEFFRRIKLEIAPLIPEKVSVDLDISSFLKQIKSFYSAKGSLNGHRILFKILFNDKRVRLYLNPRGSGAEIKVNNYIGTIPANPPPTIISGGSGYDDRVDVTTNEFLNSPIIDVLGSGTGKITQQGLRPNKTAIIKVTGINSNGSITSIEVSDTGDGYVGPIIARVRPRSFFQDQRVYNQSRSGSARVEYWDGFTNELVLYDVVGYFKADDEIISEGRELARGFVSRIFIGTTSIRDGVEIIPEVQNIEFPRDYTFKTSESNYIKTQILKLKLLSGVIPSNFRELPTVYNLRQDPDTVFGVSGVNIEIDNFTSLLDNISEYEISTNSDIDKIYLPASTEVVIDVSNISSSYVDPNGSNKLVITVDDAGKFPVANGLLYINNRVVEYKTRSHNQFFNCSYLGADTFSISLGDKVLDWGRKRYDVEWQTNQLVSEGEFRFYGENLYKSTTNGTTGSTPPTHTSGIVVDGSFALGNQDPVSWRFVSSNIYKHYFYIKSQTQEPDAKFELISLPGEVVIVDGGSLHTKQQYEFVDFDSPNTQMYNFTTSEISDRLAVLLSSNYNRSYSTVTNKHLPSYKSLIGFNTQYDYDDYIYVPTTTIPKWWSNIVDLSQPLSVDDAKKVAFTNQKVLSRWNKSGLIYETQSIGIKQPTTKAIGLNIDAVQLNSFRGNTIRYGKIDKFVIADGGLYQIPFKPNGYDVDNDKLPNLVLTNGSVEEVIPSSSGDIAVSGKIVDIDYDKLYQLWGSSNLTGFSFKPSIQVINRNPNKRSVLNKSQINTSTDILTITYQSSNLSQIFDTSDKVTFTGAFSLVSPIGQEVDGLMVNLKKDTTYFIRKLSSVISGSNTIVEYALFVSESDCLLNNNKISLDYVPAVSNFEIIIETGNLNPIDFEPADIEISYNQTTGAIDNFIVLNSGNGYIEAPTIRLSGGGKLSDSGIDIPYEINGVKVIDMKGSLISKENFYKSTYYEFTNTYSNTIFESSPRVSINAGSGAEAIVYVASGKIVSIILISPGNNYFTKPIINLYGNGKNGVIESKIDNSGQVIGFDIINQGEGYTQPPRIEIIASGSGALISCLLKEWTFNAVNRLQVYDRIDSYGGYVYDASDSNETVTSNNLQGFRQIDPKLNLAPSEDNRQYLLLQSSDKLLANYTRAQRSGFLVHLYPGRDLSTNPLTDSEALNSQVHSPAIGISYDGIPIYGKRANSIRWQSTSTVVELKSRYKLKYSTTQTAGSVSKVIGGVTYYINRDGGPSIIEYPIGSFIEDYEFVEGNSDDLDIYNGRFCVTPEFPAGRYCYFSTTQSYDAVTNEIVSDSGVSFGGFPYFIGPEFASTADSYPNRSCRSSDKIPKDFTRAFEKDIPSLEIPNYLTFSGLPNNPRYPREYKKYDKTVTRSSSLTPGSVNSIIIESAGSNYLVGDKLIVDNTLTGGDGFSGFVSKISGKQVIAVIRSNLDNSVMVSTNSAHGLSVGDYVYFKYTPTSSISVNLHGYQVNGADVPVSTKLKEALDFSVVTDPSAIDKFNNKKFFTLELNSKFVYELNIPETDYVFTYDVDAVNEHFILPRGNETTKIIVDAKLIPSTLYLHIGEYIYEITKSVQYAQEYKVTTIDLQNNRFTFDPKIDTELFEVSNISYSAKSKGATGGIEEISISNPGFNYRKLPNITGVRSTTGSDALIQTNSSTIGKIRNIGYLAAGGGFTSNQNVNYYLNLPATAKVINNFEIYDIEIVDGGFDYNDVLTVRVDGSTTKANINVVAQLGTITSVEVIDGGTNFSAIPTITVDSVTGYGAVLKAKVRRKQLLPENSIERQADPLSLFPVKVTGKVVNFDENNSTIEFDEFTGQFQEDDTIYTIDGRPYGKLVSIRRPRAYAKSNSYINLESSRTDITGNTSELLQKITDSNVYQDWSYIISSSRDTNEWRNEVLTNTHPAGHRLFGKKFIERRKFFFDRPSDVFKSSVIFTTNLVNKVQLNLKLTPCNKQTLSLVNVSEFFVGDYIYGTISGAIGEVVNISEMSIEVNTRNNINFVIGEVVIKVSPSFAFGIQSITDKFLGFWEGIFQEPDFSYEVSPFDTKYNILSDVFIPKFSLSDGENIGVYKLTNSYDYLDSTTLNANSNSFSLTLDNQPYTINQNNIGEFIFSIGGSVQNPANLTVSENIVYLNETVNYNNTRIFGVRQQNLKVLTFTGNNTGTIFTLNYIPNSSCNLLIFYTGVSQNHLLADWSISGDTITFSETVDKSKVFGWFIDENVECYLFDTQALLNYRVTGTRRGCTTKNFTQFINSSAVKHPTSLYEIRKEILDGTVVGDVDGTTVYGFDTKFTYTSPKYSSSYVEVMDQLPFNGVQTSFTLKIFDTLNYTPKNGEKSTLVYVNNQVLDHDSYTISGSTIEFNQAYSSATKCTIIDFNGGYQSNYTGQNCEILDRLNVVQNGARKTFNLSDRGVPQYIRNPGDIFVIKNGILKRPELKSKKNKLDSETESLSNNKFTFVTSPVSTDNLNLVYFNRQLVPEPTKNVVLDDFRCYDGIVDTFPITLDGLLFVPINVNNLFIIRYGVVQEPGVDYIISGYNLTFTTAPSVGEEIFVYYSYDGLNQNILLDNLTNIDGSNTIHNLTNSGNQFTPPSTDDLMVVRNGVVQNPTEDFTVTNSTISFTTALTTSESIFILYTHGAEEISIVNSSIVDSTTISYTIGTTLSGNDIEDIVVYADGTPRLYQRNEFTIQNNGTEIHLIHADGFIPSQVFIMKYPSLVFVDELIDCPDGSRTRFKLLYNITNLVISDIISDADILVSVNGVVQYPGVQYTLSANRGFIDFLVPPQFNDEIFFVRMSGNQVINLTATGATRTYDLSQNIISDQQNLVLFSNNLWKFNETGEYTYIDNNTIQLSQTNTSQYIFGIKFTGTFGLLDQIHTPYNSSNNKFNLFINQENFVPIGTVENNDVPDETGLFVIKNGKVLDPKVDYTLSGDIKSQIVFATPPSSADVISVKSFGSFRKITSITNGLSGKVFSLTHNSNAYYPNAEISRPREHENQILVLRDGNIQSPIYDYYIDNNKLIFNNNIPAGTSKIVIMDFLGSPNDVNVFNRFNQIKPGDQITISGESDPRTVAEVLSPTVLKTQSVTGNTPSGFVGSVTYASGKVTDIIVTNGGLRYEHPVVLRTKGSGNGAKATAGVNYYEGGVIKDNTVELQYPGYNVYTPQVAVASAYAFTYRQQQLNKSQVRKATKLSSSINSSVTTIPLSNTNGLPSNPPTVTATSLTGSNATFRVYVSSGKIVKIDILTPGIGYDDRSIKLEVTGGGGTGCVLEPVLDALGSFTDVIIRNQGSGYDTFKVIVYDPNDSSVDAEFIEYTYITSNQIDGCTRGVGSESYTENTLVYFDNYL